MPYLRRPWSCCPCFTTSIPFMLLGTLILARATLLPAFLNLDGSDHYSPSTPPSQCSVPTIMWRSLHRRIKAAPFNSFADPRPASLQWSGDRTRRQPKGSGLLFAACRAAAIAAQTLTPAHAICCQWDHATGPCNNSLPKFKLATSDKMMMPLRRLICRLAGSENGTSQHVVPTLAFRISLPCSVRLVLHMHCNMALLPKKDDT